MIGCTGANAPPNQPHDSSERDRNLGSIGFFSRALRDVCVSWRSKKRPSQNTRGLLPAPALVALPGLWEVSRPHGESVLVRFRNNELSYRDCKDHSSQLPTDSTFHRTRRTSSVRPSNHPDARIRASKQFSYMVCGILVPFVSDLAWHSSLGPRSGTRRRKNNDPDAFQTMPYSSAQSDYNGRGK